MSAFININFSMQPSASEILTEIINKHPDFFEKIKSLEKSELENILLNASESDNFDDKERTFFRNIDYQFLIEYLENDLPDELLGSISGGSSSSSKSHSLVDKVKSVDSPLTSKGQGTVTIGGKVTNTTIQADDISIGGTK